jgi:hypothetical protein
MRERSRNVWELVVEAGIDPVTGRRRQISRVFRGTLREAKTARAAPLTEVSKGRHTATRVTVAYLFSNWIAELERNGRSPNTVAGYRHTYERLDRREDDQYSPRRRAGCGGRSPGRVCGLRRWAGVHGSALDRHRPCGRSHVTITRRIVGHIDRGDS